MFSIKDEIAIYLKERLCSVYCDTCEHDDTEECDFCHFKSIGWGLSEKTANQIADDVMKIIEG